MQIEYKSLKTDKTSLILFATLSILWGFTWLMGKWQIHAEILPELAIVYRFLPLSAIMFIIAKIRGDRTAPTMQELRILLGYSVLCCSFNFILFYYAAFYMVTSISAIVFSFLIIVIALLKHFLGIGRERLLPIIISAVIGICGLFFIMLQRLQAGLGNHILIGLSLAVSATLLYSIGTVFYEVNKPRVFLSTPASFIYISLSGCIICLIFALVHSGLKGQTLRLIPALTPAFIFSYLYMVVSGLGVLFSMMLVERIGAVKASYTNLITPVLAVTASSIFEDYRIMLSTVFGIICIVIANYIALKQKSKALLQQSFEPRQKA